MKVKLSATGMSARPVKIRLRRLRRMSGAVSIRCTMSWSVPWVAMVTKTERDERREDRVFRFEHVA